MAELPVHGAHITLAQALKASGLAGSGGQAKHLIRSGAFWVNDVVEVQPGRKLYPGDRFRGEDAEEWVITP
jgi:ribosome-associated protein